jgi:hypothetical protein
MTLKVILNYNSNLIYIDSITFTVVANTQEKAEFNTTNRKNSNLKINLIY